MAAARSVIRAPRDSSDVDAGGDVAPRTAGSSSSRRAVEAVLGADDAAPDDARPARPAAAWVLPGLIDCHSHQVGDIEYAGVPARRRPRPRRR